MQILKAKDESGQHWLTPVNSGKVGEPMRLAFTLDVGYSYSILIHFMN